MLLHLPKLNRLFDYLPLGFVIILVLGSLSAVIITFHEEETFEGKVLWTFASNHVPMYEKALENWNLEHERETKVILFDAMALRRRMMSGFFSGTPVAELIEVNGDGTRPAFRGPLEAIGFADLTDHLFKEGVYEQLNEPSFSIWSTRGRIFGIPHDVHPVMLAYNAEIIEGEAGIDMSAIETWDDFMNALKPLVKDYDGDGHVDRYCMELPLGNSTLIEVFMLQAGGGYFDQNLNVTINSDINARVLCNLAVWASKHNNYTMDVGAFSANSYRLMMDGVILSWLSPDWRNFLSRKYMKSLTGKVKLMPLPAWEKGGLRTSVYGGTMLGIPRNNEDFEGSWELAKHLYLNEEIARQQYLDMDIITPLKKVWDDPIFDQPDPFFSNQSKGRMYIEQAPNVPERVNSPYSDVAVQMVSTVLLRLRNHVNNTGITNIEQLMILAHNYLAEAEMRTLQQINRNKFLSSKDGVGDIAP